MKRIFLCNWFSIAKCIGHYVLDFVLANVLLAGWAGCWLLAACYFCFLFPFPFSFHHFISFHWGLKRDKNIANKNGPQKSWTTLFTCPFINHFREWAHFIYFPFINHYSTLNWTMFSSWHIYIYTSTFKSGCQMVPFKRVSCFTIPKRVFHWHPGLKVLLFGNIYIYVTVLKAVCHGYSTNPPGPRTPPRNKGLIAGLIKGNQWLISP